MLRCASFFAGVGGIDKGFVDAGGFEIVYANEVDAYPVRTYEANFAHTVDCRDINDVDASEIPDFDVMLAGFPCQSFSIAGSRQGFDDEKGRGVLFFEMMRIIRAKKPSIVFLENVKNLVSHDKGNTFRTIKEMLHNEGYHIKYQMMNAMEYGNVPQNRERIYIVAFRSKKHFDSFEFPEKIDLTKGLESVIDFESQMDEKYYYVEGKYSGDIYKSLVEAIDDDRAVYQWRRRYVRKNKRGVVPTLTANQGTGRHNVCIVKTAHGIRKMTPRECFSTQGFSPDFILPDGMSDARLYKQAGNSVCVPVIKRIAEQINVAVR